MLSLFRRPTARPGRSRGRVVLRLEGFDRRDQPSDWFDVQSTNQPPRIVVYCSEIGLGQFRIYGQVTDESPGGLTVRLGGIPSAQGTTMTTWADGSFSMILTVQTNGSDIGVVTAQTTDAQGLNSNVDYDDINPTPPPG
jgi:hypothetical protein